MPCQDHDQSILSAEVSYNLFHYSGLCRSQSSKVDVVTRLHTRQLRNHYLTPAVLRYSLFFSEVFRLSLGPTKRLFSSYWGWFPWGWSGWGVGLTTHHLVLRLEVSRALISFPYVPSWCIQKPYLYFHLYLYNDMFMSHNKWLILFSWKINRARKWY